MLRSETVSPRLAVMVGTTVVFTYLLMVMGTFVTSTGSGLACPDWPLCYGTVKPPLRLHIWFEWGHRLLGASTGTLIMLSTFFVWRRYRGLPRVFTSAIVLLLGLAVALGGVTVLIEAPLLKSFIHVAVISTHLLIATLVFTCLIFTMRYVATDRTATAKGYYKVIFGIVYLQVILGILVRYSGATLACPDFPLCNGSVIPYFTDYTVALHFAHRLGALSVFLVASTVFLRALREKSGAAGFGLVLGLVILQALFGIFIVRSGMFLPYIIMHGATGFFLLGYLAYRSMPYFFSSRVERRVAAL